MIEPNGCRYAFYAGCCFQGLDERFLHISVGVLERLGASITVLMDAVCCGSGVLEERSELMSLAINARNIALAERLGLPLIVPCATCYNVLANCRSRLEEDSRLRDQINGMLAEEGLEYRGSCHLTTPLWAIAFDLGLDRLAEEVKTPLTGLRAATYYGCHLRNSSYRHGYESSDHSTSLESILRVLGATVVTRPTDECCGYHLAWPNRPLSLQMTHGVLRRMATCEVDVVVTACPLCLKSLDGAQRQPRPCPGSNQRVPVLFLPQVVGLACGLSREQAGLEHNAVPLSIYLS